MIDKIVITNLLFVLILLCLHILICRAERRGWIKKRYSRQKVLILSAVWLNAPLLGAIWVQSASGVSPMDRAGMLMYSFLVFNGLSYSYFHVFNLSETGRRVRMILEISSKKDIKASELETVYPPRDMIGVRLSRLEESGQITRSPDGRYRVSSRILLWAALALFAWRKLLGFEGVKR